MIYGCVITDGVWTGYIDQVITPPLLIFTIHRSPQHPLIHFPAYCVFNNCFLATLSNNGDSSASHAHVITVRRLSRNSKSKSHCDWQSVSKSWCRAPSWPDINYCLTVTVLFLCPPPLWREDGSVFCICCWSLPVQSFSGPSPLGLTTIFYCLRFETSLSVAFYDSRSHGGGIRPRLHPSCSLFHIHILQLNSLIFVMWPRGGPNRKHRLQKFLFVVMGGYLAIARISFPQERVYRAAAQKRMFLLAIWRD
jgi:hypothetical protein